MKSKKNVGPRKPRDQWVALKAVAGPNGVEFHFDRNTGEVFSPQAVPGSVYSYQSYERDSGKDKVVSRVPGGPQSAHLTLQYTLISRFDVIAAIDCNSYEIGGRRISIACSFVSSAGKHRSESEIWFDAGPTFILEGVRESVNPELIAWSKFFSLTLPSVEAFGSYRVALVVDSELGKHEAFNARLEPYYGHDYLPMSVNLVYASSGSADDLPNKLIRECDSKSRRVATQIRLRQIPMPQMFPADCADYEAFGVLNCENERLRIR